MEKVTCQKYPFYRKDQIPLAFLNDASPEDGTVLAGDVGGTTTNLALFKIGDGHLHLIKEKSFKTKNYTSFNALFNDFKLGPENKIDAICLGVAGPVIDGIVQGTNFPWQIDRRKISEELKVKSVFVINDLEANAYGLAVLEEKEFETLITGNNMPGNAAIISPGTGLGEAGMFWDGTKYHPFASEGGHCSFSPHTTLDVTVFNFVMQKYGDVSWERLISGQGIIDIHEFLVAFRNIPMPQWFKEKFDEENRAALITKTAIEKKDVVCEETLTIFLRYLAIEASQMALKVKATGGIYMGGGILPKIIKGVDKVAFAQNFVYSGRMASLLKMIPVKVILNEKTPLLGAAMYAAMGIDADIKT